MGELSEEAYSAGWMQNLEYALWDAVVNGERKYGHHFISRADIASLVKLSNESNCWIYYDDVTQETSISLNIWREKFKAEIHKNPNLIKG